MTNLASVNEAQGGSATNLSNGVFIVIEGTDGSGKGTQFKLLREKLIRQGYEVEVFDFPQYDQPSSFFVQQYLNGKYGSVEDVGPYTGSLFYAMDRYEASTKIQNALDEGKVVLANRFTGSNMAHQGTKFSNPEQRKAYFIWLEGLEFKMLGIPRPDVSFVLRVPAHIAQTLVDKKEPRSYTTKKRDLHEQDLKHLERSVEVYDDLTQIFPNDFKRIDCVRNDKLLNIDAISDLLWESVYPLLPAKGSQRPSKTQLNPNQNPYIKKVGHGFEITPAGYQFLESAVTNTSSDVYAFSDKLSPTTIAAAMARLSRRGDDMRITILDEFAQTAGKDQKLLERVITAYGDDSVQQLVGQHIVVENASNLLTKKLEWGRLASYLEQSTRYIYYDQKDKNGEYKYFVPQYLEDNVKNQYKNTMDQIFDLYSQLVHSLTDYVRENSNVPKEEQDIAWQGATRAQACDAIRPVLPVATMSTVGIFASGQALESLIMNLLSDKFPEAQQSGKLILQESRKIISTFLQRADLPDRGGLTINYKIDTKQKVEKLTQQYLPDNYGRSSEPVTLTGVWPRNELDLVPDMLYEHSNLSLKEITELVNTWSYDKKVEVLNAYMGERFNRRHKPGRALEKAHYSWDLVCDYGIFRDLQRHRIVDDLAWQELSPRYGYDIPKLVEDAGLTDMFESCFDKSLSLYNLLQSSNYPLEAQYAVLFGHRMRWKITYNARQAFHFHELRTSPQGHPGYRKLVHQMHEKLAEVHPLIANAMIFINKAEDPELARLASERYTQAKLSQIDQKNT